MRFRRSVSNIMPELRGSGGPRPRITVAKRNTSWPQRPELGVDIWLMYGIMCLTSLRRSQHCPSPNSPTPSSSPCTSTTLSTPVQSLFAIPPSPLPRQAWAACARIAMKSLRLHALAVTSGSGSAARKVSLLVALLATEVLADEITRSPVHVAGRDGMTERYALRVPRLVSFRDADKRPEDATTAAEIIALYQQQGRTSTSNASRASAS